MSDAQNRQIDLRDHQQAVEKKLDRIIKLLEEMNRLNPKSTYDFVITGGVEHPIGPKEAKL